MNEFCRVRSQKNLPFAQKSRLYEGSERVTSYVREIFDLEQG
jgi:hypothetical protein